MRALQTPRPYAALVVFSMSAATVIVENRSQSLDRAIRAKCPVGVGGGDLT
jgi:hypothetical protein